MAFQEKRRMPDDSLLWAIDALNHDKYQLWLRLPDLMDEIERFIESNKDEKARLSEWILHQFSELGLIAGALHQINTYQPWASVLESQFLEYEEQIKKYLSKQLLLRTKICTALKENETRKLKLGYPLDGRYTYPSDKRRTRQHVKTMRTSEQNLDRFWDIIDNYFRSKEGKALNQLAEYLLQSDRTLQRTPEWIDPVPKPKQCGEAEVSDLHRPFLELSMTSESKAARLNSGAQKTKIKTRVVANDRQVGTVVDDIPPHRLPDVQPTITLGKRAYKVLTTLFFDPNRNDQPGEIAWPDFLHAMAAAGFGPTKLHGSVWQFTPTTLDVERSILFHEPHPRNKLSFVMARRFGRRLNRAYGWHGRMFALAE